MPVVRSVCIPRKCDNEEREGGFRRRCGVIPVVDEAVVRWARGFREVQGRAARVVYKAVQLHS